jgi:1,4-dihydroxy-6-naphthoate synthase
MKLTLGFSPCPNDTFIFDALVNHKIDTEGLDFELVTEDVQTLNRLALEGNIDVTKISYGVWPLVQDRYTLLNSGSALGKGVGPLLITGNEAVTAENLADKTVLIPGENTTAHLLFSLAFPQVKHKQFVVFNQIEEALLQQQADAGVIIHENRFTYMQKGLKKIIDLGDYWEKTTGAPIPLGGIIANQGLSPDTIAKVDRLIRKSLEYAFERYPELPAYVKDNAQEMEEGVMRQHIDLYVNQYSLDLGEEGNKAIDTLCSVYNRLHITKSPA